MRLPAPCPDLGIPSPPTSPARSGESAIPNILLVGVVTLGLSCLLAQGAMAAPLPISFDQHAFFGGVYVEDHEVVENDIASATVFIDDLGPLPANVDVRAVHSAEGIVFFALDRIVSLSGGLVVTPRDIVLWNGSAYSVAWNGDAEGLGTVAIDGITQNAMGDLLVSLDRPIHRDGVVYADEDVIGIGTAGFSMAFDGSARGIASGLDLDAIHFDATDAAWFASLDGPGTISGLAFGDQDVLRFDSTGVLIEYTVPVAMGLDTVAVHAVPEPEFAAALATGIAGLVLLPTAITRRDRERTRS